MSQDMFLKLTGIDGESQDNDHKDEIDLLNWSWTIHQESNMHTGSGGGAGKASVDDFEFEHFVDRSTPNLMKFCLTGKHIEEAVLVVRKAGGNPLEYLKTTMNDVVVTKVQPYGNSEASERIRERVSLSFARVKQEYTVQNSQGGSGGVVTASYDIQKNKEG